MMLFFNSFSSLATVESMLAEVNLSNAEQVNLEEFEAMWKNKASSNVRGCTVFLQIDEDICHSQCFFVCFAPSSILLYSFCISKSLC